MSLGAMVIMAGQIGCVCEPREKQAGSVSAAAGMATIYLQQQAEEQRQQQQQRNQRWQRQRRR